MKIARIELENGVVTLAVEQPDGRLLRAEVAAGGVRVTQEVVKPKRWLAPVGPRAILCIGANYAEHAEESNAPLPEYPILFMKNPNAAIGHQEPVRIPKVCEDEVDFEGELAVFIGKRARDVAKEDALSHVFGYSVAHDVSARIWQSQKGGSQGCRGKGFDTFAPLGPVLVTTDEIPDPSNLALRTWLNGEEVQNSNTSKMIFDVPTLVSFLSQDTTLLPGAVILTGTPSGIGWAREPKLTLKPGDVVDIEIERIGRLTNPIVASDA